MFNLLSAMTNGYINEKDMPKIYSFYEYLKAAGIDCEIVQKINENGWVSQYKDIPLICWENSLLKPYTYYYHTDLRILSPPIRLDSRTGKLSNTDYYNEMKIVLTEQMVVDKMYNTLNTLEDFRHYKRDIEGLKFVLNKHPYVMLDTLKLETIDVIYTMIQNALKRSGFNRLSFLDLYNVSFNDTLLTIEEKHITPQKSFVLRTGEWVVCRGK